MTVTGAFACFFIAEVKSANARSNWLLVGFYVCAGFSLLAKGLIGCVIIVGVISL